MIFFIYRNLTIQQFNSIAIQQFNNTVNLTITSFNTKLRGEILTNWKN